MDEQVQKLVEIYAHDYKGEFLTEGELRAIFRSFGELVLGTVESLKNARS